MADFYSQPNSTITDLVGWGQYLNSVSNDLFGPAIMLITFVVMFIIIKQSTTTLKSFTATSFMHAILSLAMLNWGILSVTYTMIFLFMSIVGMALSYFSERN